MAKICNAAMSITRISTLVGSKDPMDRTRVAIIEPRGMALRVAGHRPPTRHLQGLCTERSIGHRNEHEKKILVERKIK
jgi:hypothetical protein